MTKCPICGWNALEWHQIPPKVMELMHDDVKHGESMCCELCMIGIYAQLDEYIWNGVDLIVYDEKEGEYTKPVGNVWKPSKPGSIQFVYDERRMKWMVTVK
jgi:hypothetical protein